MIWWPYLPQTNDVTADSFIMPSVLGTSTPLGHPGQTFEFDFNNTEMINTMQDWIITPGTNWQ